METYVRYVANVRYWIYFRYCFFLLEVMQIDFFMNANELRIGNFVEHNANWCYRSPAEIKVFAFQWEERDWFAVGECTMSLDDVFPTPLTEEWLQNFEFKKYVTGQGENYVEFYSKVNDDKNLTICDFGKGFIMSNAFSFQNRVELKYTHQLQNLYFALTGKELELLKQLDT